MRANTERLQWEDAVYSAIEASLEVCRSDAQAIADARAALLENAWDRGLTAAETVNEIISSQQPEGDSP